MRLNSKVVGLIVLVVMFGGILLTDNLGWWQTEGGGRGAGNHDGASESPPEVMTTLRGTVSGYDQRGLTITADDRQSLYIELGNTRYNRSIGFAPKIGERVTVQAFIPGSKTGYSAITVTLDGTGQTYAFRDAPGNPLWAGKNAN